MNLQVKLTATQKVCNKVLYLKSYLVDFVLWLSLQEINFMLCHHKYLSCVQKSYHNVDAKPLPAQAETQNATKLGL